MKQPFSMLTYPLGTGIFRGVRESNTHQGDTMTASTLALQLNIDAEDFDLEAALADINSSFGPLGRHHRLDDEEQEIAWEIIDSHRV
ncbi:hypothetical protein EF294_15740 [Gordonia oryzae]|uniref:Uncharacterized protein n=2 Tax=Gordonia oryzae TaxID=2487349 RepID=A0A3N4GB48_9ACTN|nr:hypothetical protein EF294_15740 [Gordonia oryzae]